MSTLDSLARDVVREMIAVHELLVDRLGFDPACIVAQLGRTSTPEQSLFPERTIMHDACGHVGLTVGGRTWRICVGPIPTDGIEFEKAWRSGIEDACRMAVSALRASVLTGSRAEHMLIPIAASIRARGIQIPKEEKTAAN
jgi:hypothetical protein